jgi:hypothetical protein
VHTISENACVFGKSGHFHDCIKLMMMQNLNIHMILMKTKVSNMQRNAISWMAMIPQAHKQLLAGGFEFAAEAAVGH